MEHGRRDYAKEMVEQILMLLQVGLSPWKACWDEGRGGMLPLRHNGVAYRGINILMLWSAATRYGYTNPYWLTFRQALEFDAVVRKGERGRPVCYYGSAQRESDEGDPATFRYLKYYTVFNAQQIDGLPDSFFPTATTGAGPETLARVDEWIARTGAEVRWGGASAYYNPNTDHIQMPDVACFRDAEQLASVELHEITHWSGAAHRLDRNLDRYADSRANRAFEELIAEIGSGLLGAQHGLRPDHIEDHARYIGSWIAELKNDPKYLFSAAAQAQAAVDYLNQRAHEGEALATAA
ncbi:MAG TPA: zincin-like metallopeptidase domain-containing protein [Vicinamibacterales bacterium]|nr:zincin-like metallopeptidase domain-containing protein [Vicinamibacterales bacterium]